MKKTIVMCGNSLSTLINFRLNLIKSLKSAGYSVIVVAPIDTKAVTLQQLGVEVISWKVDARGYNVLKEFISLIKLMIILKNCKGDFNLFYTIKPIIYGNFFNYIVRTNTLSVITGLGYTFVRNNIVNALSHFLLKIALTKSTNVWCLNEDDLFFLLRKNFCKKEQISLLPGEGIDPEHYRSTSKKIKDGTTFLMMSRLLKDKGVIEFVEAAKLFKKNDMNVRCVIIGSHPIGDANSIDPMLLKSWLEDNVIEYHGEVRDVRPYIESSDCIVLPSYREGLPRSILEAFCMEKLVVASNVPGCKQLVKENETGFLCEPADVESLICAMTKFISLDQIERENKEKAVRKLVQEHYSDEKISQHYLGFINTGNF